MLTDRSDTSVIGRIRCSGFLFGQAIDTPSAVSSEERAPTTSQEYSYANMNDSNGNRSTEGHSEENTQSSQSDETEQSPSLADEQRAWEHFCRTGSIIPGYSHVIAQRLKERRDQAQERGEEPNR